MRKKFLLVVLCGVLLFGITGCGSSNTKYTDNMEEMRSITIGYLGDSTLGKLLDKAIKGASWKEDENYSSTSGAIIITGKDKNTKGSVELVWLTTPDSAENGFESLKIDDIDRSYSEFLEYLKDYTIDSSSSNDDNNESSSSSNYEAEDVLNSIMNKLAKENKLDLTIEQLVAELNKENYQLLDKTGSVVTDTGVLFSENGSKVYALLKDDNDSIYSFYATYQDGNVTITQFKQER